jgi:hypothetical protein
MRSDSLSSQQAYLAMFAFLEAHYALSKADDIGALLGAMALLPDGRPADLALAEDWSRAVARAIAGDVDASFRLQL